MLLGDKDIASRRKVGHSIGDEVDVQQTGAPWAKKISRDPGGGVGQERTELGERHGLTREATCGTTLADDVAQGPRGSQRRFEGAERIARLSRSVPA